MPKPTDTIAGTPDNQLKYKLNITTRALPLDKCEAILQQFKEAADSEHYTARIDPVEENKNA